MSAENYTDTVIQKRRSPAAAGADRRPWYRLWFGWRFIVLGTLLCMASVYLSQLIGEAPVLWATRSIGLAGAVVLIAGILLRKRQAIRRKAAAGGSGS